MNCDGCGSDPCVCQRQLAVVGEQKKEQKYLFKKCANPSCSVMIGWPLRKLQGIAVCKWCQEGSAHWQKELEQTA